MSPILIDADALFRAVTATGYKLLAYNLNLDTGEIVSRTMRPEEVTAPPPGPSVRPLPKMGGDLTVKKDLNPFGDAAPETPKKKLFNDDDGPKKPAFDSEFFKRDGPKKPDLFGDGGFKKESGAKKLAEIFSTPLPKKPADPFAKSTPPTPAIPPTSSEDVTPKLAIEDQNPKLPRIPAVTEVQQLEWMFAFAKEFGDPEIRDQMGSALQSAHPLPAWDRVLRKHIRAGQQWERYYCRHALFFAETWLSDFGIAWELQETDA